MSLQGGRKGQSLEALGGADKGGKDGKEKSARVCIHLLIAGFSSDTRQRERASCSKIDPEHQLRWHHKSTIARILENPTSTQ